MYNLKILQSNNIAYCNCVQVQPKTVVLFIVVSYYILLLVLFEYYIDLKKGGKSLTTLLYSKEVKWLPHYIVIE